MLLHLGPRTLHEFIMILHLKGNLLQAIFVYPERILQLSRPVCSFHTRHGPVPDPSESLPLTDGVITPSGRQCVFNDFGCSAGLFLVVITCYWFGPSARSFFLCIFIAVFRLALFDRDAPAWVAYTAGLLLYLSILLPSSAKRAMTILSGMHAAILVQIISVLWVRGQ